jgi:hypothetical protein
MSWAIGASQPGEWAIGASQPDVAAAAEGQVITVIMSKEEEKKKGFNYAKLLPLYWLKQGRGSRRDFIKNTIITMFGMKC